MGCVSSSERHVDRYSNPRPVVAKKKAPREEPPPFKRRTQVDSRVISSSGYEGLSRSITGSTKTSILSRTPIPSVSSVSSVGTRVSRLTYEPKDLILEPFSVTRTPSESPLPLLANDILLHRSHPAMPNVDLSRSQSDSALHKRKLPDFLRHRPTFLTCKKPQQPLPLHAVSERPSTEQARPPYSEKLLPPLPAETINFTVDEIMEDTEIGHQNNQSTLRRAKTEKEKRTGQLTEDPRRIHSAETKPDQPPLTSKVESTASSEIPKVFEFIAMEEEQIPPEDPIEPTLAEVELPTLAEVELPTLAEVELPPEKVQPSKVVCGLPCDSKRKERELNYTLDVLTGIRSRKDEEKLRAEAKRLAMKKLELKKAAAAAAAMKGGVVKRRIL